MKEELKVYKKFLNKLDTQLKEYFEEQKDFIKCQRKCSLCCKKGNLVISEIEFKGIKEAYNNLDKDTKNIILEKIDKYIKELNNFAGKGGKIIEYLHECPFLIDDECSIYESRPIKCRTYGLIRSEPGEEEPKLPDCINNGLNYSNIYDSETKSLSSEKLKELGLSSEPKAYDISYLVILGKEVDMEVGDFNTLLLWSAEKLFEE